jgi:2,4-dienoyl-CoA reductase-like NADH-dependent reductase (Old Yellow Enzyme family)
VRLSATDWREDGWQVEDSVRLATLLAEAGVDLIDCSSGGIVPAVSIPVGSGFQTHLSEAVRGGSGVATGAVGMITSPRQADHIIRSGQADAVLLAREYLRDPYWPRTAARELGAEIQPPPQYARAW